MLIKKFKDYLEPRFMHTEKEIALTKVENNEVVSLINENRKPVETQQDIKNKLIDKRLYWLDDRHKDLAFFVTNEDHRNAYLNTVNSFKRENIKRKYLHALANTGFFILIIFGMVAVFSGVQAIAWTPIVFLMCIFSVLKVFAWQSVVKDVDSVDRLSNFLSKNNVAELVGYSTFRIGDKNYLNLRKKHDELGLPDISEETPFFKYYQFYNLKAVEGFAKCMIALWSSFTILLSLLLICLICSSSEQILMNYLMKWSFLVCIPFKLNLAGFVYIKMIVEPKLNSQLYRDNDRKL